MLVWMCIAPDHPRIDSCEQGLRVSLLRRCGGVRMRLEHANPWGCSPADPAGVATYGIAAFSCKVKRVDNQAEYPSAAHDRATESRWSGNSVGADAVS